MQTTKIGLICILILGSCTVMLDDMEETRLIKPYRDPYFEPSPTMRFNLLKHHIQYIKDYSHLIPDSKVPKEIILAQGILESDGGRSNAARNKNNHFGIYFGDTLAYFDSPARCFEYHSKLLNRRYFVQTTDCGVWANNLEANGYATDTMYAETLISIIEQIRL